MKKNVLYSLLFLQQGLLHSYVIPSIYQNNIFCGFFVSALSTTCEPDELVKILNDLFARFDKLASVSKPFIF